MPSLEAGDSVLHYRISGLIGTGGMGTVYRAEDERLDRPVAIKVLREWGGSAYEGRRRLLREARATSSLNHPNVVTIHSLEEAGDELVIVMEYVEGRDLGEVLADGPLSLERALDVGKQAAQGLSAAHAAGLVHRDIKPSNILVTPEGRVKVVDFGLAKALADVSEATGAATQDTAAGSSGITGTVGYMCPEQVLGEPVDACSDLFSLGCVLYEATTGRKPFGGSTVYAVMKAIVEEAPAAPSELESDLPGSFDAVVCRLLAKQPDERYASAAALLADLEALASPGRGPVAAPSAADFHVDNLPAQPTPLVGRRRLSAQVEELLGGEGPRLITLTGSAGTGKTRLAVGVAGNLRDRFPNGICFVDLSPVRDAELVPATLCQALGLQETRGRSLPEGLEDSLAAAEMLLLLDNFEQVVGAAPMVSRLLAACPGIRVLVTSREVLRVRGERVVRVPPLSLPAAASPSGLSPDELVERSSAVALFVERAREIKPEFRLTEASAGDVVRICRRLDGLPLAIELAAARMRMLPPAGILARLHDQFELLTGGARDLPDRQRTLRHAIDWSYELLGPEERTLLQRLSVFVGGCNLESAEAVCDPDGESPASVLDGLESLLEKSFLFQVEADGGPRFDLLKTIREYGLEKLVDSGDEERIRQRHARYHLELAEDAGSGLDGPEQEERLARLDLDHDNLRAALQWLIDRREAEPALRLGGALWRFWERRAHLREGRRWLERLLELPGATEHVGPAMKVLYGAGVLADAQGDYEAARAHFSRHLEANRRLGYEAGVATSLNNLAIVAQRRRNYETSRSLLEESRATFERLGDQRAIAWTLYNLAQVALCQGDTNAARAFADEGLELNRDLDDRRGVAWALANLGDVAREQDDLATARSLHEEALEIFRSLGDEWGTASGLAALAEVARLEGDEAEALELLRRSLAASRAAGDRRGIARTFEGLAMLTAADRPAEAVRLFAAAARLREELGAPLPPARREKLDAALAAARESLGPAAASRLREEGRRTPLERILEDLP